MYSRKLLHRIISRSRFGVNNNNNNNNNNNKNFIEISLENLFTNLHTFHYNNKNNDNNNNNFFKILASLCIYLNFQFDLHADVC